MCLLVRVVGLGRVLLFRNLWKMKNCSKSSFSSGHMAMFCVTCISSGMRQHINKHLHAHSVKVSGRHKEAGRQKGNFSWRHCYGCCANASICHCLVWTVVPTSGFTAAASQIHTVRGEKRSGGPL